MTRILDYANPNVAEMRAYVPGLQPQGGNWVKLNTNESPFPPSPKVLEALHEAIAQQGFKLRLYPNPTSSSLREKIAGCMGLPATWAVASNGCDDILNVLMRVFASSTRRVGYMVPSYSLYKTLAQAQGASIQSFAFDRSMTLPVRAIQESGVNVFFLTSPNAPTGVQFSPETVSELASGLNGILVVDETYAPFADTTVVPLLKKHPNLVITRSFSKAYSLASLRIGFALAHPEVIDLLDRVRDSYNVDGLAQAAACAALSDPDYYREKIAAINSMRDAMTRFYKDELGWFVYNPQANFHFVEPRNRQGESGPTIASAFFDHLNQSRILVRYFTGETFQSSFVRISVGSESDNQAVRKAALSWLGRPV